jgi:hypothetical protein
MSSDSDTNARASRPGDPVETIFRSGDSREVVRGCKDYRSGAWPMDNRGGGHWRFRVDPESANGFAHVPCAISGCTFHKIGIALTLYIKSEARCSRSRGRPSAIQ